MPNLEIEYKAMLNKQEFEVLFNYLKNLMFKKIEQINYYYETDDFKLKKTPLSLRTRKIQNKFYITLKETTSLGKIEYEYEINNNSLNNVPLDIQKKLMDYKINIEELKIQAELKTIRYEANYLEGIICLDHNFYNNIEDYEIEYESNNFVYSKKIVERLCKINNIDLKPSGYSKQSRALKNKN